MFVKGENPKIITYEKLLAKIDVGLVMIHICSNNNSTISLEIWYGIIL